MDKNSTDVWQGEFGWQAHALTGRPDLLNYLRQGDFGWPDLWQFYEQKGLPSSTVLARCSRLFHQYQSWQLDLEGGYKEPDGEILSDLLAWAQFCLRHPQQMPDGILRDELTALAETGSISPTYFECAYECYLRALVEEHSRRWMTGELGGAAGGLDDITPCRGYGKLRVVVPEDAPDLPIAHDLAWQRFKRALAQQQHDAWCASYSGLMQRLEDMTEERPGL